MVFRRLDTEVALSGNGGVSKDEHACALCLSARNGVVSRASVHHDHLVCPNEVGYCGTDLGAFVERRNDDAHQRSAWCAPERFLVPLLGFFWKREWRTR